MLGPFLLLCVASAALAQLPHPCTTPKQWEGRQHSYDPDRRREKWAKLSYDETLERVREIEEVRYPSQIEVLDLLFLHKENTMYVFDLKSRKCNVSTIDRPFFPFGVPPSANFTGTRSIGAAGVPNEHLILNIFTGAMDGVQYMITTTSPDCVPVTAGHTLFHPQPNTTGQYEHREFFDITPGISDPEAFIPHPECLKL